MQQWRKAYLVGERRIVWSALVSSAIALAACTQYHVAMDDGGSEHAGSGGTAGSTTTGKGGAAGSTIGGTGGGGGAMNAGAGGVMNTGAGGGTGGLGVDGGTPDAKDAAAEKPVDAPVDSGPPLLANGASCSTGTDCQSKNCVDGVCCESTCTGQCQSCGETNSAGKCITISGAVRGKIRPGCTGTGACAATCNGSDPMQCHYPAGEKPCGSATCSAGVAHAAATCDGAGNCPAGATSNCDPFICGATACKTTCATSADCATSSYCAAPNCVSKKGQGVVCGAGEQCTTGICGGLCCSTACTCPQQSPANLFTNAGFDSDLSDWGPTVGLQWSSQDVDNCPYSGSLQVLLASGYPQRCVSITPGTFYSIGGWFRNTDGALWICGWETFTNANCTGDFGPAGMFTGSNVAWAPSISSFQAPGTSQASLLFSCDTNGNTFVDKIFLTTGNGF